MGNVNPETIVAYLTIVGTIMYWLYSVFVAPMKDKILTIAQTVNESRREVQRLSDEIRDSMDDRRELGERLSRLEASTKSAHERISRVENLINNNNNHHE